MRSRAELPTVIVGQNFSLRVGSSQAQHPHTHTHTHTRIDEDMLQIWLNRQKLGRAARQQHTWQARCKIAISSPERRNLQ